MDERSIMRDLEAVPKQTRDELTLARIHQRERDFDLTPFQGGASETLAASQKRLRVLKEFRDNWQRYFKGGLAWRYLKLTALLKQKPLGFWNERQEMSASEIAADIEHELAPFQVDLRKSDGDAARTYLRIMDEAHALPPKRLNRLMSCLPHLESKKAEFWLRRQEFTAVETLACEKLELPRFAGDSPMSLAAEKTRARILYEMHEKTWFKSAYFGGYRSIVSELKEKDAAFWFAHQEFNAAELLELRFTQARKRAAKRKRQLLILGFASMILAFTASLMTGAGESAAGFPGSLAKFICFAGWLVGLCFFGLYALLKDMSPD